MAFGLLATAPRGLAVTMTWTNGNDVWNSTTAWTTNQSSGQDPTDPGLSNVTCIAGAVTNVTATCVGGTGGFPSTADTARFTNDTSYTVNVSAPTTVGFITFSNTAGAVTLNAGSSSLSITGRFRIADGGATSTVVWAGGTLSAANSSLTTQIGSANSNSVGVLIVTNGTVITTGNVSLGTPLTSVGKLIISGPGVVTNAIGQQLASPYVFRARTPGSEIIITNGGKLFWAGEVRVESNSLMLVSDTNSLLYCTNNPVVSSALACGDLEGPGCKMIISNGATVFADGTISIGRNSGSSNTGIVVGAGSKLISSAIGNFVIGVGSATARDNSLTVYDGGYVECGGPFFSVPGGTVTNASFYMGGAGAISTGLAVAVRGNSQGLNSLIVVTNAVFTCTKMSVQGSGSNALAVLSKGTLNVTAFSTFETNGLSVAAVSGALTINAGTINAVSGTNALGVTIGGNGTLTGNSLTITNGGKLLSELGTIGPNSSLNTGVVTGVGSIWSNYTAGASFVNSNSLIVGGGTTASGSRNYLAVQNGATLVNNGSLQIGNSGSSTLNSVLFGGPGAPAVIINSGMVNVGGGSGTSGNSLTISNASLNCDTLNVGGAGTNRVNNTLVFNGGTISANYVRVRLSNTVVFTAGTLSAGGLDIDPGANNSNVFVVGDGTSAAYYDMAAGGTGYHGFSNGGLVVTNGASLRGSGTLTGTMTVLGTFVPGFANAVGSIFTSNSLTFGSSAVLNYDLGTVSDTATINGNLALGNSIVNVTDSGGFGAGTYVLLTHTNTVTAPSGTLTVGTLPAGFTATVSNDVPTARVLLVVSAIGGGDPYATWLTHYGLTGGNALGTADPDADGMSNTNEFLAGFNPTSNAAYLHVISVVKSGNNMNITYLGANGDSTYSGGPASRTNVLEFTTGTVNGSYSTNNFASTGQTNILSGGTGAGVVTNMVDSGGATNAPSRYYRVRVLVP
jgi:hypothetical protein